MNERQFEARRREAWDECERLISGLERGKPAPGAEHLPRKFREMCTDLSLANHRMYRAGLTQRLNDLVIRGYKLFDRGRRRGGESFARFVLADFPAALGRDARLFWLCSAMFWLPFFGMMAMAWVEMDWIQAILGPHTMANLESMYGHDADQIGHLRSEFGSNFAMFGYYIQNNVSIDFRMFAGGIVACLGTVFFLIYNGLAIGASAGYVSVAGNPQSFWTFVSGHSSFELIGMTIAGVAGMKLGLAVLRPGRLTRAAAIGGAARDALPLIYGAAGLTVLAAVIEAFWSAQPLPDSLKYGFGISMWVLHALYFTWMGRRRHAA
jgi:uncharacterized membrane protein SpoIIM required for sporulation